MPFGMLVEASATMAVQTMLAVVAAIVAEPPNTVPIPRLTSPKPAVCVAIVSAPRAATLKV